jgi:hypothetical protein
MGFFKKIGKGLKKITKVISLKNAINISTGNAGAVVQDLRGRIKEGAKEAFGNSSSSPLPQLVKAPSSVQFDVVTGRESLSQTDELIGSYINTKVNTIKQKLYKKPEVVNTMNFFKKEVLGYYWQEYKTRILLGLGVLVALVVWLVKRKPSRSAKRGR